MFKEIVRKHWRYIVVSLALIVGITLLSRNVIASVGVSTIQAAVPANPANHTLGLVHDHTEQSVEGAATDTDTPTSTTAGSVTPSPAMLVGHVIWERISQPNSRNVQPVSLTLSMGGTVIDYPNQNTDASGFFTVSVDGLASGTYNWRAKGPNYLAKAGTVTLTGDPTTQLEIGTMLAGDALNDNVIDAIDFSILRAAFGNPEYDGRADFDNNGVVNAMDLNMLKINSSKLGAPPDSPVPPSSGDAFLSLQPDSGGNCTAPPNGGTVQVGCRFVLDMMVNMGSVPDGVAMQSYMTYTSSILPNARVSDIASSCVPTNTMTQDLTTFDATLDNYVCNGPAPCVFGGITVAPGSFAYVQGALTNPPSGDTFRVAQIGLCAVAQGQAVLHWQVSPPAQRNRHTAIVDVNGNMVQDQSLFTDYVINVIDPTNTPTVTRTFTPTPTPTNTITPCPSCTDTPTPISTPNPCNPIWSVVSSPNGGIPSGLSDVDIVTANDVWAVGFTQNLNHTLVEHWDGTSWSVVPSPNINNNSYLWGVGVVSANDVWAVGSSCNSCSPSQTVIEHWDGTSWSVVPSPNPIGTNYLYGVAVVSANDVWAVGKNDNSTLIEHWDGTSWSVVPSPNPGAGGNVLYGITAISANDVWAVGCYNCYSGSRTLVEHWDGTSWSVVPSPNVGTSDNRLNNVAAVSANDVWAVGYSGGQTLIEHWDGTSWSVVPSPNIGALNDVAVVTANDVWAVNGRIIHWDGTSWSVVPSPNVGALYGIAAVSANDMWAVGGYGSPGRTLVEHYATVCGTPTTTPTPGTPTSTPTNTQTPCAGCTINGHLTWQGVAPANRPSVTGTLQLCVNGSPQIFPFTTNSGGYFTVTTFLPDGTYHWWIKGGRHISNSSPLDGPAMVIINGYATQEFGTLRGGNANTDNIVNATDFSAMKGQFGLSGARSADFDYNNVVATQDFAIQKGNFGLAGHSLTCP